MRIEGAGLVKTYPVNNPKRRKRSTLTCTAALEVTIPRYDLQSQNKIHVTSLFHTKSGTVVEQMIGELELNESSNKVLIVLLKILLYKELNFKDSSDFWKFVKTNWKILSICIGGGIIVIILVTILGCYLKKKRDSKEPHNGKSS